MRRVLAIIGAVVLIALAVVIRSRLNTTEANTQREASKVRGTLVCATELTTVCDALKVKQPDLSMRIEDAGVTQAAVSASGFSREAAKIDAWLAPRPYVQMAEAARSQASLPPAFGSTGTTLARSPLVMAVWNDRLAVLQKACPGGADWKCIGGLSGTPWSEHGGQGSWGPVKPGIGLPTRNATGLFTFAQASGQQLGRTDFAANDLDDPSYRAWVDQFQGGIPSFPAPPQTPLSEMLSFGPSSFDVAGSIEALAVPSVTTSREKDRLAIVYPSPTATMDVVAVAMSGSDAGERMTTFLAGSEAADAFVAASWRIEGRPTPGYPGAPASLPADNGLPRPGVLQALTDVWKSAS